MKKLSLIILALLMVSGCGSKTAESSVTEKSEESEVVEEVVVEEVVEESDEIMKEETIEQPSAYLSILEEYANDILFDAYREEDEFTGVNEMVWAYGSDVAVNRVGYLEIDLDQDGVNELLIGDIPEEGAEVAVSSIFDCYTLKEGEPVLVFNGWARNNYQMLSDGKFVNSGSSGYASTTIGDFHVEKGEVVWDDFYFSDIKDESTQQIGYYTNTDGVFDKSVSEELDMSEEDFWNLYEEYYENENRVVVDFIPFATLVTPEITIEEVTENKDADVILASGEGCVIAQISALEDITGVAFYDNTMEIDALENVYFDKVKNQDVADMKAGDSILVQLQFVGDSPTTAIGFVDQNGYERYYAIMQSGYDGSLVLSRIQ